MPVPTGTQPMERQTVRIRAFNQLRDWIEDGTLGPGEMLKDHDIALQLGISRTPVREALQMLEQLGAIETVPGSHTRVAEAAVDDLPLVLEPLAALQSLAVVSATPHITKQDIKRLEAATDAMREALRTGDALAARRADDNFHGVILDRCNNAYLLAAIEPLLHHARRLDSLYFADIEMTAEAVDDHLRILEMVRAGDAEKAGELTWSDWFKARRRARPPASSAD